MHRLTVGLVLLVLVAGPGASGVQGAEPPTPKIDLVRPLEEDPVREAPGVFFFEDLETIQDLKDRFQDQGLDGGRFRISDTDALSGTKAIQQTYRPLSEFADDEDPGSAGWVWRFFGDNPQSSSTRGGEQVRTAVARWYHKFQEGFQPRDGWHFPPKMGRMRSFAEGEWRGVYTVLFWIGGKDGHLSIERHTRAPGAHREWTPNAECRWDFADPINVGRWVAFELRVALGDKPRSDRIQAWADGILVCDIVNDDTAAGYRKFGLNAMSWDCYWNGGSPVEQSRFYDDLVLSTEPVGPVRTPLNPVIVRAGTKGDVGEWEVQVAKTLQKPLVPEKTIDGVVTRYRPAEFFRALVWQGNVSGEETEVEVGTETGEFQGVFADRSELIPNTFYMARIRQRPAGGVWTSWSPWHAGFATTWAEKTPPEKQTAPNGYLLSWDGK